MFRNMKKGRLNSFAIQVWILIAELRRAKRASGAPRVRNFGNLSMQEILVMTSAYAHPPARPPVQTLGEGEWSPKAAQPRVGGGE